MTRSGHTHGGERHAHGGTYTQKATYTCLKKYIRREHAHGGGIYSGGTCTRRGHEY